jgi:fructose-bisphosphate aldolase class I
MYDLIHQMRTRIITSPGVQRRPHPRRDPVRETMDREIEGRAPREYLWEKKQVVPFLKVDKGLADEANGAQAHEADAGARQVLAKAKSKGVFGTKMRSVIKQANAAGIEAVVASSSRSASRSSPRARADHRARGRHPRPDKAGRRAAPQGRAAQAPRCAAADEQLVMLKLTLPNEDDFYADLVAHPRVLRVVALSGGYSRDDANAKLRATTA